MRSSRPSMFAAAFQSLTLRIAACGLACIAFGADWASAQSSGYLFSTLAGHPLVGSSDGTGPNAGFSSPNGVAFDREGNLVVADTGNRTIRKITPAGVVTTFVGTPGVVGSADGIGPAAQFRYPASVAIDGNDVAYVADAQSHTIRRISPDGVVSTLAGAAGVSGTADGTGSAARFDFPTGVAVDRNGNVYVADSLNATIRKVTPAGVVTTLAGLAGSAGAVDGPAAVARFTNPTGIAVDGAGNVFISDGGRFREISTAGMVSTLAGQSLIGSTDGPGTVARFNGPAGLAVDSFGNIFVADSGNAEIREVSPSGVVSTIAGAALTAGGVDGIGTAARFNTPVSVALDANGNVYVADSGNSAIRKIAPGGVVTTFAGRIDSDGSTDGTGDAARFDSPEGIAVDLNENVFVADPTNKTIRKITPEGVVTTLAGAAGQKGSSDGPAASARFGFPSCVAVDSAENVFVGDEDNCTIRKITPAGIVSTFAGQTGNPGWSDGLGTAAQFVAPTGLAFDAAGNLYVADRLASTVRKITPAGLVTTLAGQAGMPGVNDGVGTASRFGFPEGIAVDGSGNVYVGDSSATIRRIAPDGTVTTIAGKAGAHGTADGVGANARFAEMFGLAADRAGNLYVVDLNNTIRKVTPSGLVTTLAGRPGVAGSLDGDSSVALFNEPFCVAVDRAGDLYITDSGNHTIRKAVPTTRLINLSIRSRVGSGDNTLVGGFAIAGGSKRVLVRGVGPTLANLGVFTAVADTQLALFDPTGGSLGSNDDWGGSAALSGLFNSVGAFPLDPVSKDSALDATLMPGAYTAHVTAPPGVEGVALLEMYDADSAASSRLINASARTMTGNAENALVAGFVLAGSAPKTVLIRGVGPSLTQFGLNVGTVLHDPRLSLYNGNAVIAQNDDWGGTAELKAVAKSVGAFDLASDDSKDAVLLVTLDPGAYTVLVAGADSTPGVALVEVYEVR